MKEGSTTVSLRFLLTGADHRTRDFEAMVTAAKAGRKSRGCCYALVLKSRLVQGGQASKANSKDPASKKSS